MAGEEEKAADRRRQRKGGSREDEVWFKTLERKLPASRLLIY